MSKSVASEFKDSFIILKTSRKRGRDDEEDEDEDGKIEGSAAANSTTVTMVSAALAVVDAFMHTPEFRRHLVDFVPVGALVVLRSSTKVWKAVAEEVVDEGASSGEIIVHDGKAICTRVAIA
ncbi:hypothetical protein TrLO_g13714 [Triparma laevis f. longispina]|uniref:Uncharacterized protein n=1 Tax=Triparma laevis f. longispina TaxID=1714387 RepID=A0A9W7AGX3_9STRA|nr:hypothetical protein TrLO_g13714 [Triparma laevis f. longispina]